MATHTLYANGDDPHPGNAGDAGDFTGTPNADPPAAPPDEDDDDDGDQGAEAP